MLGRLEGGVLGPVMGYLTDRFGAGAILVFGGLMSGLGFIFLSQTNNLFVFMVIFVGMLSVGFRSGYNHATLAAVKQSFRRQRSVAMSIVAAGNGLGGAVLAPLEGLMVASLGWRTAAFVSGLGILIVVVPLSFLVRRSPESMGLLPDDDQAPTLPASQPPGSPRVYGATADATAPAASPATGRRDAAQLDFTAPEAMRTLSYWLLNAWCE